MLAWIGSAFEARCQRFGLNLRTEDRLSDWEVQTKSFMLNLVLAIISIFWMKTKIQMCAQSHKQVGSFEVSDSTDMWIKCLSCVLRSIYSINPFFPLEVLVVFMFNQLSIAALRIWYARASDWPDSPELRLEPEFIWNMWIDNEWCLQVLLALEWLSYRSWVMCNIIHWNCVRLQSDADWVLLMVCSPQSFTFGWHRCVKNVATLVISSTQPLIHHSICHITDWSFGCWQCLWVRHLIWDDFIARSVLPVPVLMW